MRKADFKDSSAPLYQALPRGIKILAWARTVRWIGWGFGESLLPIFIFQFSDTFAEAGLFRSTYEIALLAFLPLVGVWADRVSAKRLIIFSLLLSPLVGVGYLLAGLLGVAAFVVLTRILNALLWAMENVGLGTYYRRMADQRHIGAAFGYIESWANFGWIIAALIGMLLSSIVPIHYLLLAITPAAFIAFLIALYAPSDTVRSRPAKQQTSVIHSYRNALEEWRTWDARLWLLGAAVFFAGIIQALMWFFIPIDAYANGAKPSFAILLGIIATLPSLFGYTLGRLADKKNEYVLMAGGLVGIGAIMLALATIPHASFKLIASFLLGLILELFFMTQQRLLTTLGMPETYGRREGAFDSIATLGDLAAPLILGIALDELGFPVIARLVAVGALLLGIGYVFIATKNQQSSFKSR